MTRPSHDRPREIEAAVDFVAGQGRISAGLKGSKCPLVALQLATHWGWVEATWTRLVRLVPGLDNWIRRTQLVGYSRLPVDRQESRRTSPGA